MQNGRQGNSSLMLSCVQCGRIFCEDAFLKASYNSRQILKHMPDYCAVFVWGVEDSHYFKLYAQSEKLLIFLI
jgi:hypothetical protein